MNKVLNERQPPPSAAPHFDWKTVRRVLVVRLRSIGDTVLATPSLIALKRFLPEARIDILLENWVAPVLDGFDAVDEVVTVNRKDLKSRWHAAREIRCRKYDVVYNLHGGPTSTFFVRASGAPHRVGYRYFRYNFFYNHLAPSSSEFWRREIVHSAEHQLALLGFTGVPVSDRPRTRLAVTEIADRYASRKLHEFGFGENQPFALFHPAAAFESKLWATENFARVAEFLYEKGMRAVAVGTPNETEILSKLKEAARIPVVASSEFDLPQTTALAARARLFVGNDSGIAHIAAAVGTPGVVVFGSLDINHWRPWTDAPHEIVYERMPCAPCAGYVCKEFEKPECIRRVTVENVTEALKRVLAK